MEANKFRVTTVAFVVGSDRTIKFILDKTIPPEATLHAIRTRRAGANRKTLQGKSIVADTNFEAAFITLKKGTETVIDMLPLEEIEKATNVMPQLGYPIELSGIDWNVSYVEVAEGVALSAGNCFELTFTYSIPKR